MSPAVRITPLFCRLPIKGVVLTRYSIFSAGVSGSTALSVGKNIRRVSPGLRFNSLFATSDGPVVTSGCRNSNAPISGALPRLAPVISTIFVPVPLPIARLPGNSAYVRTEGSMLPRSCRIVSRPAVRGPSASISENVTELEGKTNARSSYRLLPRDMMSESSNAILPLISKLRDNREL